MSVPDWPTLPFPLPEGTITHNGGDAYMTYGARWMYVHGVSPDALFHIDWPDAMNREGPSLVEVTNFASLAGLHVNVDNFPAGFMVAWAGSPTVSVSNFPSAFNVGNFPTSFQVSNGTLTGITNPIDVRLVANNSPEQIFKSATIAAGSTTAVALWTPAIGKRIRLRGMRIAAAGSLLALTSTAIDILLNAVVVDHFKHLLVFGTTLASGTLAVPPFTLGDKGYLFPVDGVLTVKKDLALLAGSVQVTVWGVEE